MYVSVVFCDVLLLFSVLLSLHEPALELHTTCHQKLWKIGHTTIKGCLFMHSVAKKYPPKNLFFGNISPMTDNFKMTFYMPTVCS